MRPVALAVLVVCALTGSASAQSIAVRADLGVGLSVASRPGSGATGRAAVTGTRGRLVGTLRGGLTQGGPTPFAGARDLWDRALLAGVVLVEGSATTLSVSAGVARTEGSRVQERFGPCRGSVISLLPSRRCDPYTREREAAAWGIALEATAWRRLTSRSGLSLTAFGILNEVQPYAGLAVGLTLSS